LTAFVVDNQQGEVMDISAEQLGTMGFVRAGTVHPACGECRVEISRDVNGFAVYAMVAGGKVKKFGTTGRKNSGFRSRMSSTFSALRQTIRRGSPYAGDPFKRFAPATVLANQPIELWVKPSTEMLFEAEETLLNNTYRPEWTKEGCR